MSQSYYSSTDPQSSPGTSGMVTYTNHNAISTKHIRATESSLLSSTNNIIRSAIIGNTSSSNYVDIDEDGFVELVGDATVYIDELAPLITQGKVNPSAKLTVNTSEGTLAFTTGAGLSDYVVENIQINHMWKIGSTVYPHLHWEQNSSNVPNFLIEYRWKYNGYEKTTEWTRVPHGSNAFTYVSGILNQITSLTTGNGLTPSSSQSNVSTILQLKLIRDTTDASGLFGTTDLYSGDVQTLNMDVHIEVDSFGSNEQYIK